MTEPRALNETIFVSPRMRCRRWRHEDLAGIMQVYGDADAMRYVGDGSPIPHEDAERWLGVTAANYERRGYGMFTLEDRATGQLVGFVGLVHPDQQPEAEVKYAFVRAHWGKGLATEAVRHLLTCAAERFGLTDVIATVAPEHTVSQRVLEKAGMRLQRMRDNEDGSRTLVYGCALAGPSDVADRAGA